MSQMILTFDVASRFESLKDPIQICDPAGRVLGRFFPESSMSRWEPISPEISEEELDRRQNSEERRYTTAEVLAYLENLK